MFGQEISFDESLFITLFSMAVVFVVLAVLVLLIKVVAGILNKNTPDKGNSSKQKDAVKAAPVASQPQASVVDSRMEKEKKAAIITAAIAAYRGKQRPGGDFYVRSYRKVNNNETPWELAARNYN